MKLKKIALATILACCTTSLYAGNFVTLGVGTVVNGTQVLNGANGGLRNGNQNPASDIYNIINNGGTYLSGYDPLVLDLDTGAYVRGNVNGDVVATSLNYQTTGASASTGTFTLLDWRVTRGTTLAVAGQADVFDFVYQDSADGSLVFATRYLNRLDNSQEANYLYRSNYSTTPGYRPGVAWMFATDYDLRMYQGALTSDYSFNNQVAYTDGIVRQKGDFSVSEGNPWSGLFLVKTDAKAFTIKAGSIGFTQAGEEGQSVASSSIAGFAATNLQSGVAANETTYVYGGTYGSNTSTTDVAGDLNVKSDTTFNGNVVAKNGSEINAAAGTTITFNGAFNQQVGALLDGGGIFQFNGGYSAGNSPGSVTINGDVVFGAGNSALFEIAGILQGSQYDHTTVTGTLTFGGVLEIAFLDGFTASAGQTFDLFDFASASGTFSSISFTNATLGAGLAWDTTNLYTNGSISVAALPVPEPESYALMMLGLGVVAMARRQKKQS